MGRQSLTKSLRSEWRRRIRKRFWRLETKNQGKPPQCIKEVLVEPNKDEPKGRKKKPETKNVFGE